MKKLYRRKFPSLLYTCTLVWSVETYIYIDQRTHTKLHCKNSAPLIIRHRLTKLARLFLIFIIGQIPEK